jgi:hypothetical protein
MTKRSILQVIVGIRSSLLFAVPDPASEAPDSARADQALRLLRHADFLSGAGKVSDPSARVERNPFSA